MLNNTVRIAIVLVFTFFLGLGSIHAAPKAWKEIMKATKSQIKEVDVKQAVKMIKDTKGLVIIDVRRGVDEYELGHIKGAHSFSRSVLEFRIAKVAKNENTPILIYCAAGGRGAFATKSLKDMGYKNVTNMLGGFGAWMKAGLPVENKYGTFSYSKMAKKK